MNILDNGSTSVLEIMQHLTYGELQQNAIGNSKGGQILEANYPKVMSSINRGVNQIQRDLAMHENNVRVELQVGIVTYPLHSRHSLVTGTDPVKFISDSEFFPFADDIGRITHVYNKGGEELPVNVLNDPRSVYIPRHNVIQYGFAREGDVLAITYLRHTKPLVVTTAEVAAETYLGIPDYALSALYAHVASTLTSGIATDLVVSVAQSWRNEYESRIAKLKLTPFIERGSVINTKLTDRGFI